MDSQRGFIKALWCGEPQCEKKIKDETMATIRIILSDDSHNKKEGECVHCGKESSKMVLFAKAY
jgi:prolyl-tRNA synthetase